MSVEEDFKRGRRVKKIAFTVGDPCGVGPEIIRSWIAENPEAARAAEVLGHAEFLETLPGFVSVREIPAAGRFEPGRPSADGAALALGALEAAAEGCRDGMYSAVVTGPVSKIWMAEVMPDFVGQTEFFQSRWGGEPVMCFAGARMIVALATWHIALRDVPGALTREKIARAVECAAGLASKMRGAPEPKIAVCGLNPHAGEGGILGREEMDLINPLLCEMSQAFPGLSRALPPDTVFNRLLKGEFDAAVAMYHDQGLGPLKSVEFDRAVNISMGLPFVRTSPDHGTAFGIAGSGKASNESFGAAVEAARILAG